MGCDREDDVGGRVLSFAFSGPALTHGSLSLSLSLSRRKERAALFPTIIY